MLWGIVNGFLITMVLIDDTFNFSNSEQRGVLPEAGAASRYIMQGCLPINWSLALMYGYFSGIIPPEYESQTG